MPSIDQATIRFASATAPQTPPATAAAVMTPAAEGILSEISASIVTASSRTDVTWRPARRRPRPGTASGLRSS